MKHKLSYINQTEYSMQSLGNLQINVVDATLVKPIENAMIKIALTESEDRIIENTTTDISGNSAIVKLNTPLLEYSNNPKYSNNQKPYTEYTIHVSADGFEEYSIAGAQVFPDSLALQNVSLQPIREHIVRTKQTNNTLQRIPPHALFYNYGERQEESEIKSPEEIEITSGIVHEYVFVPQYIIVHDGEYDKPAPNHKVLFKDYIKNVASSEIYPNWHKEALKANILAILSFSLNRVFTEWYTRRNFTITSSTKTDHKWVLNRNIYESISQLVDELFTEYLVRPANIQPFLAQYCDGKHVTCPKWMRQWESQELALDGYNHEDILKYFYGDSININKTSVVQGSPETYKLELKINMNNNQVRTIQKWLNGISQNYPAIKKLKEDGVFGVNTQDAVKKFQEIFKLPITGIINRSSWYRISEIYVGIKRL